MRRTDVLCVMLCNCLLKENRREKKKMGHFMFESISNAIYAIDDVIWGWWIIILLFGTHVFMTFRTGFIQWKSISRGIKLSVTRDPEAEGEVSNFGALTTALAATIGTGNIVGVGTAIALGGPGAVLGGFWALPQKDSGDHLLPGQRGGLPRCPRCPL